MNPRQITSSALAAALALGYGAPAAAHMADDSKDRCYGVAKAGQNDCSNLAGTHDCSGEAAVDNDPGEWMFVAKGSCRQLKGMSAAEAKAAAKAHAKAPARSPAATSAPTPAPAQEPAPK